MFLARFEMRFYECLLLLALAMHPSLKLEDSRTFRWAAYNTTQLQGYSTLIFILTATLSSPSSPPQLLTRPLSTFSSAIVPITEYTHRVATATFLCTFHYDGKISLVRMVGCTPSPFHSTYHHEQSCDIRSSWEGRYTPPISPLLLKGTVPRDFRLLFFFMNQFPPSPWVFQ
jgi:hypothetical protein